MSPNYLRLFLSRFPCSWLRDRIGRNYCIFNFFGIPAIPENCRRSLNSKKIKEQKSAISCRKNYGAIAAALSLSLFIHSSFSSFSRESFVRCARKKNKETEKNDIFRFHDRFRDVRLGHRRSWTGNPPAKPRRLLPPWRRRACAGAPTVPR